MIQRSFIRRWARRGAIAAGVAALLLLAGALWLVRDPSSGFEARQGVLAGAHVQESVEADGFVEELVELRSSSGLTVELALKRPVGEAPASGRPAALLLGGVDTGRKALKYVPDTRGSVVIALNYPYAGDRKPKGLAVLGAASSIRAAVRDTPPAIRLALDWMLAQPGIDASRIELVGVSLGAPFACIAGALDERVHRVWAMHGGGDVPAMLDAGLRKRVPWAPLRAALAWSGWIAIGGPPLAPERWVGRIAPRPFILVAARDDARIPADCARILYDAAGTQRELVWMDGGHVDTDKREIARQLVDLVLTRMHEG